MKASATKIPDVIVMTPEVFADHRGYFYESFNQAAFNKALGQPISFVQDNHSQSAKGVLRGLHYQIKHPQGKLVRVVAGSVFSVAVDLRLSSSTFGQWTGVELSAENHRQLWIPAGFAHGFLVISGLAELFYKATDYYFKEFERCISWSDADLAIQWPVSMPPIISDRDRYGTSFINADKFD